MALLPNTKNIPDILYDMTSTANAAGSPADYTNASFITLMETLGVSASLHALFLESLWFDGLGGSWLVISEDTPGDFYDFTKSAVGVQV